MARPTHHHDCLDCTYLGTIASKWNVGTVADLYVCGGFNPERPSVIARYGDDGPDYSSIPTSMVASATANPDLWEAYVRYGAQCPVKAKAKAT